MPVLLAREADKKRAGIRLDARPWLIARVRSLVEKRRDRVQEGLTGRTVRPAAAIVAIFATLMEAAEAGLASPMQIVRAATHAAAYLEHHIEEAAEAIVGLATGCHALAPHIDASRRTLSTGMQDAARALAQVAPAFVNAFHGG
jgi:hypothetical protein